jgi:MoaA/NifB/PqqE/SkfB family radical SAM enzyme/SAM-dependent methyltransferase/Zn finger protein HypA/HybF involved in hydrogenase expression
MSSLDKSQFSIDQWQRYEYSGTPVYLEPQHPTWFVPDEDGDNLLQAMGARTDATCKEITEAQKVFVQRLPHAQGVAYPGRGALLQADALRELWLHITDRCNLACRHCLFSSGPVQQRELPLETILARAHEAATMGCRIFALTGGEPLVHQDFKALVSALLEIDNAHVVILTNGLLLREQLEGMKWPRERLHLQISVDGTRERHDHLRGHGSYARLEQQLEWLRSTGCPFTLSMCVERDNAHDMAWLVEYAAAMGASNVHFMWYFIRGRGTSEHYIAPEHLLPHLIRAYTRALELGIGIDNIDSLKSQVFAPPGTIHDGANAGWESGAIGPDGHLYPTAATVGVTELQTPLNDGDSLEYQWSSSPILERVRRSSVVHSSDPWRYILGGGDIDHSYFHAGTFSGADPYLPLLQQVALYLITAKARDSYIAVSPALRLKMGDVLETCGSHGRVALLHSNCLLALAQEDSRTVVKNFYTQAVGDTKEDILNPVCYEGDILEHIPAQYRFRGYGCGSPVLDAELHAGEAVTDLGCGTGVECFIAARQVGAGGRVIGVDMLGPMLELARAGAEAVRQNLGYDNLVFTQGYLEDLPVDTESQDVVISNCVLNLSSDKRATFRQIFRILKPGGRMVVSDVVCEEEPDAAIRNDEKLHGECIAGALTQKDLLGLLSETGMEQVRILKRFPYRVVQDHPFFSITFIAMKPQSSTGDEVRVLYPGPARWLYTPSGHILQPGHNATLPRHEAEALGEQVWQLDRHGYVTNITLEAGCNCSLPPEALAPPEPQMNMQKQQHGCMRCGAPLVYVEVEEPRVCTYCGKVYAANAWCEQGHFVCDACHSADSLDIIERLCSEHQELDMYSMFQRVREHPAIPLHGPQYHSLVPAVIISCVQRKGFQADKELIRTAIQRGSKVMGGSCAFLGTCGAATGVGIALSLLLEATPVKARQRQLVQEGVGEIIRTIATYRAARCCQRDSWLALKHARELVAELLDVHLEPLQFQPCTQAHNNAECIGEMCPLWAETNAAGSGGNTLPGIAAGA